MRRTRLAMIMCLVLPVGCGTSGGPGEATAPPSSTTSTSFAITDEPTPAPPTTTTTVPTTTSTVDPGKAVAIAEGFLSVRNQRDIDATLAYLAEDVVLDMGPGRTYETLQAGMAWEEVFGFTAEPQDCDVVETDREPTVVFCEILVQTSIHQAKGGAPGIDCVHITIEDDLIVHAETGVPGPNCVFDYWSTSFAPLEAWMSKAHPDTTMNAMYNDRLSPEGLALWDQYITEYLNEQGS